MVLPSELLHEAYQGNACEAGYTFIRDIADNFIDADFFCMYDGCFFE
jgi:hypothetical protein